MPQIYYLWDFEDGTMQGWEALDPAVSLDSSGRLQGTYSVRIVKDIGASGSGSWNVMRIRNIDIVNTNRPLLVLLINVDASVSSCRPSPADLTIILYDSLGNQIASSTFRVSNDRVNAYTRVITLSLEPYKSSLNTILFNIYFANSCNLSASTMYAYFDMIAIVEADSNYNMAVVLQNGEAREIIKTLGISIPNSRYVFVGLSSPPWFHPEETTSDQSVVEIGFIRTDGVGTSLSIDSSNSHIKHANNTDISQLVYVVDRIRLYLKITSIAVSYAKYTRYVAVVLMNDGFTSYNYIMLFKIQYTVNPHTPMTQTGSVTVTPGQSITQSFEMTAELRFNSGGVRLRVVNVTGNYTDVLGGTITLSVYDYYTNVLVGSASVNPSSGNNLLSDLVVINPDTRYRLVVTFNNISVRANASFRGYIVYEVS